MKVEFEWHNAKAEVNLKNHGVSFDLAKTVFKDRSPSSGSMTVKIMARSGLPSSAWRKGMFCYLPPTRNVRNEFV
jgi:hypothetical protein